jgi:tRNA pseudouridine65 synthase
VTGAADGLWGDVPFGPGVRAVAVDANGLGALDKPAGMLSHPNGPRDEERSLVRSRYDKEDECFEWTGAEGQPRKLWLVNRLDSATSGLILVAAHAALAREIRAQFRQRRVRKVYQAVVFGKPRQPAESWRDVLNVRKQGGRIRTLADGGNLPAESRMTLVRSGSGPVRLSLLRLEPQTGRSHQLRVQCAKRGLPIVGDQTYGDFGANRAFAKGGGSKRLFLHSLEIAFDYEFEGRPFAFSARAPLPAEFDRLD